METSRDMDKLFGRFKREKIALYGLGTETKRALAELGDGYAVIGLLDSFRTDGRLYGKPVISFDSAVREGVKLIIVVARPGSCRAIAKKIGKECRDKNITLLDIRGKDLLETRKVSYRFCGADGVTKAELEEKIRRADVVSFDLFDTLVMRQTLYSDDVVKVVDCRLKEKGIFIDGFCDRRLSSEKALSTDAAPTLAEIYQNVLENLAADAIPEITAAQLAGLEWDVDFSLIVPRKEVCSLFERAVKCGKKVYVVSDTYYSRNQLAQLLEKCGIVQYTDILSSSDYRTGKTQELYHVLKEKEQAEEYLHIGDDIVADIQYAGRFGLNTCRLFSGLELLEALGGLGVLDFVKDLSDHLKAGMFVARIFNTPFLFENKDRQIEIATAHNIGYLFCAPIVSDFILWFYDCMHREQFQNIWFSARDGYLIQKMYTYLIHTLEQEVQTVYFLTSRSAAIRAGMRNREDICYVEGMQYSGSLEGKLKERFGIYAEEHRLENSLNCEEGLLRYQDLIIEKARTASDNYQKYIRKLNVRDGDVAFFDFVAKGTTQLYLQRLIGNHLRGFYFLRLEKEYMKERNIDIQSFYADGDKESCAIYNDYYILETLLTAPHPSIQEFDDMGKPVYAAETRTARDISCFTQAQEGIFDYFQTYIALCPKSQRTVNRKLAEIFLELIHEVRITDHDFLELIVEDSFFNRMTKITDVI